MRIERWIANMSMVALVGCGIRAIILLSLLTFVYAQDDGAKVPIILDKAVADQLRQMAQDAQLKRIAANVAQQEIVDKDTKCNLQILNLLEANAGRAEAEYNGAVLAIKQDKNVPKLYQYNKETGAFEAPKEK